MVGGTTYVNHTSTSITLLLSWGNNNFYSDKIWDTTIHNCINLSAKFAYCYTISILKSEIMSHKCSPSNSHFSFTIEEFFIVFKMRGAIKKMHANHHIHSTKQAANKNKYLLHKKFPKRQESMQSKKSTRKAWFMK